MIYPSKLLTFDNEKTRKGEKKGWLTAIMHLLPHKQNSLGKNFCAHASPGCAKACLNGAGRGGIFPKIPEARDRRSVYFIRHRKLFMMQLVAEISLLEVEALKEEASLAIRLNGTSDIPWENYKTRDGRNIFESFREIQFYDYTKSIERLKKNSHPNYHLTFSRSEENELQCLEALANGFNVAVVFDKLPKTWNGYPVVNGDDTDLRFLDDKNVVVGLKYKNLTSKGADNEKAFVDGFAIKFESLIEQENGLSKSTTKRSIQRS